MGGGQFGVRGPIKERRGGVVARYGAAHREVATGQINGVLRSMPEHMSGPTDLCIR